MRPEPKRSRLCQALLGLALLTAAPLQAASFVYEGQLDDRGVPANGRYDIRLAVYRDAELGATLSAPLVFNAVEVRDGRFRLDFEARLDGDQSAWVELAVRDVGAGSFSTIPGRTKATQAPAVIGACWSTVGDSGSNPATHFLGTTDAQPLVLRTRNAQSLRIEPTTVLSGGLPITANIIAGSSHNAVLAGVRGATIAGGGVPLGDSDPDLSSEAPNRISDSYGSIGGGYANVAGDDGGTTTDRAFATIGGGFANSAAGSHATVAGGSNNSALAEGASVLGGTGNATTGQGASLGGGVANNVSGVAGVVSGGLSNTVVADYGVIGGGSFNAVYGNQSTVAGGTGNCAGAAFSWAGGHNAKVRPGTDPNSFTACDDLASYPGGNGDVGSFVWSDNSVGVFASSGPNQFAIRAVGGLRWGGTGVNSSTSPAFTHQVSIGSNTCDSGSTPVHSRTWINHPLLDDNPNAVIVLTPNFGSTAGGGVAPPRNPVGLYYNATAVGGCPAGRWVIYQLTVTAETLNNGARFNAWFVLP